MSTIPLKANDKNNPFRGGASFSLRHRIFRAIWILTWGILASWTPPSMRSWRRFLLRAFGAKIGTGVQVYGKAKIWYPPNIRIDQYAIIGPGVICYSMAPITIGAYAVISQRAHLCCGSHDVSRPEFQLYARSVNIGENAWVCAEAFVGPGVHVAEGSVLGARGVAFSDLEAWSIYRGNPAIKIKDRTRFERL